MNKHVLEGFLEAMQKHASTYAINMSGRGGDSFTGNENGAMHRFVNEGAMRNKAFGGFKSSGTFQGISMGPAGLEYGGRGDGGFIEAVPGGMVHNYAPSAALSARMAKLGEKTLREAFEDKIDDGKWTGGTNNTGYPKMRDGDKIRLASHVALELAGRGPVPDDKVVAHANNDKRDLRPQNLRITTQKANLQQAEDQGRWRPRGPNKPDDEK